MAITKVWVTDDCTACGLCEDLCPEVFTVDDLAKADPMADFESNDGCIREAAESCPVEAIHFEEGTC